MKKLLLFVAVAVITISNAQSQELRIGVKAGVNFASVGGDFPDDSDGRTSFHIGGLVEVPIFEKFAIQPELLYSGQGSKSEYDDSFGDSISIGKEKLKLDYINIPIMAKYYIIEGLSVEAGPQFGLLFSAKNEFEISDFRGNESGNADVKDFYKTLDIAFGLGSSYRLDNGLFFSARYVIGLTDITDDSYKTRNGVLQLSAGFSF